MVDFEDTSSNATYFADDDIEEVVVAAETATAADVVDGAFADVVVEHLAAVDIIVADGVAVADAFVVVVVIAVGTSELAALEIVVVVEAHSIAVNDTAVVDVVVD